MLVIQLLRGIGRLPVLMLIGLGVMAVGGALDVIVHLIGTGHHVHDGFVPEHGAHLIGIAGMVLVLAGLVRHGASRHRRPRAVKHGGLESDAHR